jgi:xanthine dehydrogenase accessory factor
MHRIEQTACDLLAKGQAFVMATVIRHQGATPRTAGSKMIITRDGQGIGTIGGGALEARVMGRAPRFIERGLSELMVFELGGDLGTSGDMICGGSVDVLLSSIAPNGVNLEIFGQWRQMTEQNRRGCLVCVAQPAGDGLYRASYCLINSEGKIMGRLPLEPLGLERVMKSTRAARRIQTFWLEKTLVVVEPATKISAAYLFGAGHVARPTAHLAAMAGFQVWVLDDRDSYAIPERFPEAHQVSLIGGFERAFDDLAVDSDSFVVICTHGHLHDKMVLARALATDAGYIGMIGSRRKRDTIYEALREEGVSERHIERVYCPIGLAIGAETPEEIAVSIVAEMILHRSRKKP